MAMIIISTIAATMIPMNQGEVITRGARSKQKKMSNYNNLLNSQMNNYYY